MALTPAIFFGHGSPMLTLSRNHYTNVWAELGQKLPKPKAIVCISAHYFVPSTEILISTSPRTIHDFGGFPQELYGIQYPAPGDPELARRIGEMLAPLQVDFTERWGYDHGTWTVLRHVYPDADVPIVVLSIDLRRPASHHHEIGRRLAALREENVLIVGSGNLVHNLMRFDRRMDVPPYEWAATFDERVKELIQGREFDGVVHYERLGREAELSAPTPDHYLPLLYVLGATTSEDSLSFPIEGIAGGSMSMRAVQVG